VKKSFIPACPSFIPACPRAEPGHLVEVQVLLSSTPRQVYSLMEKEERNGERRESEEKTSLVIPLVIDHW